MANEEAAKKMFPESSKAVLDGIDEALDFAADQPSVVPECTCNSPHIMTHAIWCEQYKFWET